MIGSYVKYKGSNYVVVEETDDKYKIIDKYSNKLFVNKTNTEPTRFTPAEVINHEGTKYLVTRLDTIISLKTNKIMKWGNENGNRKLILAMVKAQRGED